MSNWDVVQSLRKSLSVISFYGVTGVEFNGPSASVPLTSSRGGRRGAVVGFSAASSRRMRHLLLSHCGPSDFSCYAVTLTVRDYRSPTVWRLRLRAFAARLVRAGGCAVWRVELQRRGTPHLHCVVWLPPSLPPSTLRNMWLEVWSLFDRDHKAHAVHFSRMTGPVWLNYCAAHASKHKQSQLGWRGRQWGVWGRSLLGPRPQSLFVYDHHVAFYAIRLYDICQRFRKRRPISPFNRWIRFADESERHLIMACFARASIRVPSNVPPF